MHPLTSLAASITFMLLAIQAHAGSSIGEAANNSALTVERLIREAPFGKLVTVSGCYLGTRHGISLHDCSTGFGSGLWLDLDKDLRARADGQAFLSSSFRIPALRDPPPLRVRVTGRLAHSDDYVPGGTVFVASTLECFSTVLGQSPTPCDVDASK